MLVGAFEGVEHPTVRSWPAIGQLLTALFESQEARTPLVKMTDTKQALLSYSWHIFHRETGETGARNKTERKPSK